MDYLSFGLSSLDSEEFAPQILGFSDEVNGQGPFTSLKSTRGASKLTESEGEKTKTQVGLGHYLMRFFYGLNIFLAGLILLVTAIFFFSDGSEEMVINRPKPIQKELPKSPFAEVDDFFEEIGEGIFSLAWVPPQVQLPDLRNELIYHGKNCRPDAVFRKASFHLSLKGSDERSLIKEGEKIYLIYQGQFNPKVLKQPTTNRRSSLHISGNSILGEETLSKFQEARGYVFSPGNQPTPLWFEIQPLADNTLEVHVSMVDEKGVLVVSPYEYRSFHLQNSEFSKFPSSGWELGGHRVDTTLLVRQKARWIGSDLFLETHGGDEFSYAYGKERLDFLDGEHPYSCFVSEGDFLIWDGSCWQPANHEVNSETLPLLVVKKIDDKIMTFDLWDPEGKGKIILSLIRSRDHIGVPDVRQEIKFVGAKTWAQFIVECRHGGRMTLKLNDWLVLTPEGWTKLDGPDQIDAYVNQEIVGPLFILDKIEKQNGRQVLMGHLFNATRTEMEQVELTASSTPTIANFYRHIPVQPPLMPPPSEMVYEGGKRCD